MDILVCVKQASDTTEIKIDPVINTLVRDGVPGIVGPLDGYALETAACIEDANLDTKVVMVSMDPNQVTNALKERLAIAVDKAYLVSDWASGGSDTLVTSYISSHAIRKTGETEGKFDTIFYGKQAIDGNTAQMGPEIVEHLGLPQMTCVLEAETEGNTFRVLEEEPDCNMMIGTTIPYLITSIKPGLDPRYFSIKRKMAANRVMAPIPAAVDLPDIDLTRAGLKNPPTEAKKSFCPECKKDRIIIKEDSDQALVAKLAQMLSAACPT